MHHVIKGTNGFASLKVDLDRGETLKVARNAVMATSGALVLSDKTDGGMLRGLARKFIGHGFSYSQVIAPPETGWIMLAPAMPGGIATIELYGPQALMVESRAFLAASLSVSIGATLSVPFKDFNAVKIIGPGLIFLAGFGAVEALSLRNEQTIAVDAAYLLAWEESVVCSVENGKVKAAGPGRVWLQNRSLSRFKDWLGTLPQAENSGKLPV